MPFTLPDLPYAADALAPHMSAETLDIHHGKHHRSYIDKVNEAVKDGPLAGLSLVQVVQRSKGRDAALFNNAAQAWNHGFFWKCLAPAGGTRPSGRLAGLIDGFGGRDTLLDALAKAAVDHFASGWAWLVLDGDALRVTSYHDADTPIAHGATPLFALDVWEHAYYVDYRHERPKFAEAVLRTIVNWDFVAQNLDGRGAERADQPG